MSVSVNNTAGAILIPLNPSKWLCCDPDQQHAQFRNMQMMMDIKEAMALVNYDDARAVLGATAISLSPPNNSGGFDV